MSDSTAALLERLSDNSVPYRDPLAHIDWHLLESDSNWLPETALSLYGLPQYEALSASVRRRLSQYEFVNVMQCGLWLERVFLQRLSRRLNAVLPHSEYEYLLHELREESGHSLMFLRAIEASALPLPSGAWRAPLIADLIARRTRVGGALFWLAVVIAEDVADKFNRRLRQYGDQLHPAVRQICTLHVVDEARHITFARSRLDALIREGRGMRVAALAAAARLLLRQLAGVFYFPPVRYYELAGISAGLAWRRLALANPVRRAFVGQSLAPTVRMLESYGLSTVGRLQ